jgi:hypothetical protein
LVAVSVNQQQLPEGSKAKATGTLLAVGIAHSLKVAVVAANAGRVATNVGKRTISKRKGTTVPNVLNLLAACERLEITEIMTRTYSI